MFHCPREEKVAWMKKVMRAWKRKREREKVVEEAGDLRR